MRPIGIGMAAAVLGGLLGCESLDTSFLDTGDLLIVSAESGVLYASAAAPVRGSCDGGARIKLVAQRGDGAAAENTRVLLWLTGSTNARLSVDATELDGEGTSDEACVLPGATPGMVTLHARSGPIESVLTIEVRPLAVPTGGSLILSLAPVVAPATPAASACGVPVAPACSPGSGRAASVTVRGLTAEGQVAPEGARLTLTTGVGGLTTQDCPGSAALALTLVGGVAEAKLCVSDLGGTSTVEAQSGTVRASAPLEVRAVPRSVLVTPTRAAVAAGEAVAFVVFVADCAGQGIASVPLTLQVRSGVFSPEPDDPHVVRTGADGSAVFSGTATAVPLEVDVQLLGAPQVHCQAQVEVTP